MPSAGTRKRISRIRRRAIPEVLAAFEQGKISAKRADLLLYLEPEEQRQVLFRIQVEREAVARRSRIAAEVIRRHINAGNRDLAALRRVLRIALCSSPIGEIEQSLPSISRVDPLRR